MFVKKTNGIGYAFAHRLWMKYYWRPINEFGFRDGNVHYSEQFSNPIILFIGDSITAGSGIKDYTLRYTNLIAEKLRKRYVIINAGIRGSDTYEELMVMRTLQSKMRKPHIIVLQYYLNDIHSTAMLAELPVEKMRFNVIQKFAKNHFKSKSFFLDFLYWEVFHPKHNTHKELLVNAYKNEGVLNQHLSVLDTFVKEVKSNEIELVVIIFPILNDLAFSKRFTTHIEDYLVKRNVYVINFQDSFSGIPLHEMTVNNNDAHPSELLHTLVADKLFDYLMVNNIAQ